ncbi:DUF4192 family protein [Arthrobacter sp. NPDC057013]|uniref:DUF4192 family protein n=1 Tax=Arthrobacter sp. NPDC057013 TaxID=3345999 RepID=UPI003635230F
MTAPEHLTISGPEDILGYIPHSLGYWPSDSLVAMTMQGKRLGATLRVDLPEGGGRRGREAFARTVAEYLLADKEADGTLLAFFTHDGLSQDGGQDAGRRGTAAPTFRPLLADLECALGLAGMPVRDAWCVGEEYWRNVYCTDNSCCPLPGRPVAEIRDSRLNAEMVYLGSSVGAPPGAPSPRKADTPAPDDAAVMAAERDWARALAGKRTLRAQFDAVLAVWAAALEALRPEASSPEPAPGRAVALDSGPAAAGPGGRLEPEIAGFLRASLRVPAWRDAVLVMAAAGRDAAATGAEAFGIFSADDGLAVSCPSPREAGLTPGGLPSPVADGGAAPSAPGAAQLSGTGKSAGRYEQVATTGSPGDVGAPDGAPDALPGYGEVLLGLSPPVPDWDTLRRLERLMQDLSSCGGGEAQAAALTAAGWIEWCRGRGSFAHASLTRAMEAAPGYRLAELLSEVVRRGTICGWAGRREAAWQKFGSDAA